jgi:hypothetical protein
MQHGSGAKMSLYDQLVEIYPELTEKDFGPRGEITLQNDSDGEGDFIVEWNYSKPIPEGFKLGK